MFEIRRRTIEWQSGRNAHRCGSGLCGSDQTLRDVGNSGAMFATACCLAQCPQGHKGIPFYGRRDLGSVSPDLETAQGFRLHRSGYWVCPRLLVGGIRAQRGMVRLHLELAKRRSVLLICIYDIVDLVKSHKT
jgi:hypothetical protein